MAVVNRNSTSIANAVAEPIVLNSPINGYAEQREVSGVIASAATDDATSIGRFHRIPSNARVSQVLLHCLLATTAGAIDIGIYDTADNGGAVVDADFFASALALTTPDKLNLDVTFESGVYTVVNADKALWQALGLTVDPKKDYDVAYTITTTFNGGPTAIGLRTRFVI